jgi:hypothetical protein
MPNGGKIILGCGGFVLYAIVTFGLTCVADYFVCWALWRITGDDGYMRVGWVFAFVAWPLVFVAGVFVIASLLRRREARLRGKRRGFEVAVRPPE